MILFDDMVFGPIKSRRLGLSLGVNLLPSDRKICNYDCFYCECGWTADVDCLNYTFFQPEQIEEALENKLIALGQEQIAIDSITFSGNGEPTLHPQFPDIVRRVRTLRDRFVPQAITTVISNATRLVDPKVFEALLTVDKPLLKLDAGTEDAYRRINRCKNDLSFEQLLAHLIRFGERGIIQTMMVRGVVDGQYFDNTQAQELEPWLDHISHISPRSVMLYSLDRETPASGLQRVRLDELEAIADTIKSMGIDAQCF